MEAAVVKEYVGGADKGNNGLKLVLGKINGVVLPNPIKVGLMNVIKMVPRGFHREVIGVEKAEETLDVVIRSVHMPDLHEKRFFVDKLAVDHGPMQVSTKKEKMNNPFIMVPFLTALAMQMDRNKDEIIYKLMGSLPVKEFKKDRNARLAFVKSLQGTYEVEFVSTAGMEGWKCTIHLTIELNAEGMSVIHNQMTDGTGRIIKEEWQGESMGAIDLGGFSFDVPVVDEYHRPAPTLCRGEQIGVLSKIDDLCKVMAREHGVQLSRSNLEKRIREGNYMIPNGKDEVDIKPLVDEHFSILCTEVIITVDDILSQPNTYQIKRFFLCGGGTLLVPDYFNQLQKQIRAELVETSDPVWETAQGNCKLAIAYFG